MNINEIFPAFLLRDRNGYALAKAIEAGLSYMERVIDKGLACVMDCDTMPEWRLDEMAWETNCLYDYNADVEKKRKWIKDALPQYRLYGTPEGIYRYVRGYFDDIILEEWWEYGGEPYHFRITVDGNWTPEDEAWARKAVGIVKNVRSVLDAFQIGIRGSLGMTAEGEILARFTYPMTSEGQKAGTWPETAKAVKVENADAAIETEDSPCRMPYTMTGTVPDVSTMGAVEDADAAIDSTAEAYEIHYPAADGERKSGTYPENAQAVSLDGADVALESEAEANRTEYPMAATEGQKQVLTADAENISPQERRRRDG